MKEFAKNLKPCPFCGKEIDIEKDILVKSVYEQYKEKLK